MSFFLLFSVIFISAQTSLSNSISSENHNEITNREVNSFEGIFLSEGATIISYDQDFNQKLITGNKNIQNLNIQKIDDGIRIVALSKRDEPISKDNFTKNKPNEEKTSIENSIEESKKIVEEIPTENIAQFQSPINQSESSFVGNSFNRKNLVTVNQLQISKSTVSAIKERNPNLLLSRFFNKNNYYFLNNFYKPSLAYFYFSRPPPYFS